MTFINKDDAILRVIANIQKAPLGSTAPLSSTAPTGKLEAPDFKGAIRNENKTAFNLRELENKYPITFTRLSIYGA